MVVPTAFGQDPAEDVHVTPRLQLPQTESDQAGPDSELQDPLIFLKVEVNLVLDRDALFAMTLTFRVRADYQALVEKRNMASLRNANQARIWGQKLLAADPNYDDGYLASGSSKYIVGNLAAPVRWLLRIQGISGDNEDGLQELKLTAEHGHYLAPLARILLAVAYLRNNDVQQVK